MVAIDVIETFEMILKRQPNGKVYAHSLLSLGEISVHSDLKELSPVFLSLNFGDSVKDINFGQLIETTLNDFTETRILTFKPKRGRQLLLSYELVNKAVEFGGIQNRKLTIRFVCWVKLQARILIRPQSH